MGWSNQNFRKNDAGTSWRKTAKVAGRLFWNGVRSMLDQEIASLMRYLIDAAFNPMPYYYNIPEDFITPAIFFPQPEIRSDGDTFSTYALEFSWFVKIFGKNTTQAQGLAFAALTALQRMKNVVPLIGEDGEPTGRTFRLHDPSIRAVDDGAAQLTLRWDSRRPYYREAHEKAAEFEVNLFAKNAFESAIARK